MCFTKRNEILWLPRNFKGIFLQHHLDDRNFNNLSHVLMLTESIQVEITHK
jgi:hypothetical protein